MRTFSLTQLRKLLLSTVLPSLLFTACKSLVSTGVIKDANTGMLTRWTSSHPESVILLMNQEQINHTDIPLGESFQLIAKNVQGLVHDDGKITVGCSLSIKDKTGKSLLQADDLFAGNDRFDAAKDQWLRCTIQTGSPMQWDEHYDVQVRFWDKKGPGQIESSFSIHSMDIP